MPEHCVKCGQFVTSPPRFRDLAGDFLCHDCYDPDLDVDTEHQPIEPDDIPGYELTS